jgi:hypothetical protein
MFHGVGQFCPYRLMLAVWLFVLGFALVADVAHARDRSSTEVVEITYWTGWSGHELAVQKQIISAFERAHPNIRVNVMSVAGSYEKVTISFAAGNPPNLMCPLCGWMTWRLTWLAERYDRSTRSCANRAASWMRNIYRHWLRGYATPDGYGA